MSTTRFPKWLVGGKVRDDLLGIKSKDWDFSVEAPSFDAMRDDLVESGFEIFAETPDKFTIRAHFPRSDEKFGKVAADFVLCRKEGPYSDGRHPDWVKIGTFEDDIFRRDLTVNALARDEDGNLIDLVGGVNDLNMRLLRFVGTPMDRIREDALRVLRVIRFAVTKSMTVHSDTFMALRDENVPDMLSSVSAERKREELERCFKCDTLATFDWLERLGKEFREAIFCNGLRLEPTMKS